MVMISTKSGKLGLYSSGNAVGFSVKIWARTAMLHKKLEAMMPKLAESKQRLKKKTNRKYHRGWGVDVWG